MTPLFDMHFRTASLVYDTLNVSKEQRRHGKILNVLAAHGVSDCHSALARLAGITEDEAKQLIVRFRERVLGTTEDEKSMTEPWQPPEYLPIVVRPGYTDYECGRCGVLVMNLIKHNQHHYNLDQLKDSAVALSRVLVPSLPPGSILLPSSISVKIVGGAGGEAGNLEPDGTIAGGGQGQYGSIGHGGSGNNPDIPECPICHAVGGGGHGGGCPNIGKSTDQWVSQ